MMRTQGLGRRGQSQHQMSIVKNRRASWCRGQSIIEYLLVAVAVIIGIAAVASQLGGETGTVAGIGVDAASAIDSSAAKLGALGD